MDGFSSPFGDTCSSDCAVICEITGQLKLPGDTLQVDVGSGTMVTCQIANKGTGTILFEITVDGAIWLPGKLYNVLAGGGSVGSTVDEGLFQGSVAGFKAFRVRAEADYAGAFADVLLRTTGGSIVTFAGGGGGGILVGPIIFPTRVIEDEDAVLIANEDYEIIVRKPIGAPTLVILPDDAPIGRTVRVSDGKGDADPNNITIQSVSGTINGVAGVPQVMAYGWQTRLFRSLGPNQWSVL